MTELFAVAVILYSPLNKKDAREEWHLVKRFPLRRRVGLPKGHKRRVFLSRNPTRSAKYSLNNGLSCDVVR